MNRPGRIVVKLDESLERLGWLAKYRERSRSWILRKLIDAEFAACQRRAAVEAIAAAAEAKAERLTAPKAAPKPVTEELEIEIIPDPLVTEQDEKLSP